MDGLGQSILEEGLEHGIEQGKLEMVLELIQEKILTAKEGAKRLNMEEKCYSALYLILKTGVFRRINWRVKHTHLICRLIIFHVFHTRKSRPLAV